MTIAVMTGLFHIDMLKLKFAQGQIGVGVDPFRYCRDNGAADRNPRLVGIRLQGQLKTANGQSQSPARRRWINLCSVPSRTDRGHLSGP